MPSSDRVVVVGGRGQLGTDMATAATEREVTLIALGRDDLDLTRCDDPTDALAPHRPTAVINTAGLHQVDRCELEPGPTFAVNAVGALRLARAAAALDAHYTYISTDYVFPGNKPAPADDRSPTTMYVEEDPPHPINVYGASKLAGEAVATLDGAALIVRVSSLFGVAGSRGKGGNFVETMLRKSAEGESLRVVNDQWMTPTYTRDAARAILDLVDRRVTGIVHVTNPVPCTWYRFAEAILASVGSSVAIQPVASHVMASRARRPANSALHTGRLHALTGNLLPEWPAALDAYLRAKGHVS